MENRCPEFYKVVRAKTERFDKSAIPSMVRLRCLPHFVARPFIQHSYLDVLNNFQLILLSVQLLLDIFITINNDCQHHVDQDPAHRDREQKEHEGCNAISFL